MYLHECASACAYHTNTQPCMGTLMHTPQAKRKNKEVEYNYIFMNIPNLQHSSRISSNISSYSSSSASTSMVIAFIRKGIEEN